MYAIVKTGGKQVKVSKGDTITVEKLDTKEGAKVTLDQVLLINDNGKTSVGTPLVAGATVTAKVTEQKRDKKVIIFKKKRRQNYRRKKGHRQSITTLTIEAINTGSPKAKAKAETKASTKTE